MGGRTSRLIDAAMPSFSARRSYSPTIASVCATKTCAAGSGQYLDLIRAVTERQRKEGRSCPDGARGQVRPAQASQRVGTVTRTRTASRAEVAPAHARSRIWRADLVRLLSTLPAKKVAAAAAQQLRPRAQVCTARTCRSAGSATCRPAGPNPADRGRGAAPCFCWNR